MINLNKNKKLLYSLIFTVILASVVVLAWPAKNLTSISPSNEPIAPVNSSSQTTAKSIDKNQFPTDSASSLWAIVNKGRVLPSDYVPAGLMTPEVPLRLSSSSSEMKMRADAAIQLKKMFEDAKRDNINLQLESGYRSYSEQSVVYSGYVASSGMQQADTFSARPGHSEHQTGLAADIEPINRNCEVEQCFADTPEGKWLASNSYKYGFIIRYTKENQQYTGYEYEPWHVRYVGYELAMQTYQSGQTLEQFFGLPNYTSYPSQSLALKE